MPTLAPKLPWLHPFAGGYPRRGGQALPTDPDAIDYLNRVAAADGAAVEVGIAQAIDAFVRGCKADNAGYAGDPTRTNWDAIQACCIMAGARTISGALVPLKGTAPTAQGGWTSSDYSRGGSTPGLKGNGSTLYLDSNRANDADGQDDQHVCVMATTALIGDDFLLGNGVSGSGTTNLINLSGTTLDGRSRNNANVSQAGAAVGFVGMSRSDASQITMRGNSQSYQKTLASQSPLPGNIHVYATNGSSASRSDARLAFYSIGASLSLSSLDSRITKYVSDVAAAIP